MLMGMVTRMADPATVNAASRAVMTIFLVVMAFVPFIGRPPCKLYGFVTIIFCSGHKNSAKI